MNFRVCIYLYVISFAGNTLMFLYVSVQGPCWLLPENKIFKFLDFSLGRPDHPPSSRCMYLFEKTGRPVLDWYPFLLWPSQKVAAAGWFVICEGLLFWHLPQNEMHAKRPKDFHHWNLRVCPLVALCSGHLAGRSDSKGAGNGTWSNHSMALVAVPSSFPFKVGSSGESE